MPEPEEKIEAAVLKIVSDALDHPSPDLLPPIERYGSTAHAALTRCRDAWLQAYHARMARKGRESRSSAEYEASQGAANAFRAAMPQLADYHGIRDFIACIAYGVLINAIPPERTGQLLYAAQTAVSLLPRTPNPTV
jgi:hypothetical protein